MILSFWSSFFFCQALEVRMGGTHRKVELPAIERNTRSARWRLLLDVAGRGNKNADCLHHGTLCVDSIPYQWHHFQEFGRVLKAPPWVFGEEHLK